MAAASSSLAGGAGIGAGGDQTVVSGRGFLVQGRIPGGADVHEAMIAVWEAGDLPFPERLLAVLLMAERAGGPVGWKSAALHVAGERKRYGDSDQRWIDLRVDHHPQPVVQLERLLGQWRLILDRPDRPSRRLRPAEVGWLQEQLGVVVSGRWNDETEAALELVYGRENLENRWLGGADVDPQAWEHIRLVLGWSPH